VLEWLSFPNTRSRDAEYDLAGHTKRNKFVHAIKKKHQCHRATQFLQCVYSNEVYISTPVKHIKHYDRGSNPHTAYIEFVFIT
jgi:hypothetical protein